MQRRVFCEIVESRMREVAVMVRQQIERSGLFGVLPGGVVLTGGGSQMPAADQLFESTLQHLRVRRGVPKVEGQIKHSVARPELATAVGLARYAMDNTGDDLETVVGDSGWKQRVRSLWGLIGGR
jgi:cell division protein FtsA